MGGRDVKLQLLHEAGQARSLALGEIEHQPRQRRCVDDRVLERALQPPPYQPGVEGIVAVLDEDGALSEAQERPAGVPELRCANQHRAVDLVALLGVRIDGRPAVDKGVEERQRTGQLESLGAKLEHQEWGVARRLNVDGDELGIVQGRLRAELRRVHGNLFPLHELCRTARLEKERLRSHRDKANARRANRISSALIALSSRAATA